MTWNPHKMMGSPLQTAAFFTRHKVCYNSNAVECRFSSFKIFCTGSCILKMSIIQNCIQKLKPLNVLHQLLHCEKSIQSFKFFVQIKQRCIHSNLLSYFVSSITYLLPALYLTLLTDCVDRISFLPATRPMLPTCSNRTSSTTSLTTQATSPYSVAAKTIPSNFG